MNSFDVFFKDYAKIVNNILMLAIWKSQHWHLGIGIGIGIGVNIGIQISTLSVIQLKLPLLLTVSYMYYIVICLIQLYVLYILNMSSLVTFCNLLYKRNGNDISQKILKRYLADPMPENFCAGVCF